MLHYRSYRNTDPPSLVQIWNEALPGRGAVKLVNTSPLEYFAFAKPYFDPAGLIVALEGDVRIGFAHAGFGPNPTGSGLAVDQGVIAVIGVRPSHRRRGIGSELLRRCEAYLRGRGARTVFAGQAKPLNPFYYGLYGGSDMPGFLASDEAAAPFLAARGYHPCETFLVFQRRLDRPLPQTDGRFPQLRRRFDVQVHSGEGVAGWWQECVLGPLEFFEFRLVDKPTGQVAARADVWEMEGFSYKWGIPAVGIVNLAVREDLRRQGLAKFLVGNILRELEKQYFGLAEIQVPENNLPAVGLCRGLGFEQVDLGRRYRQGT